MLRNLTVLRAVALATIGATAANGSAQSSGGPYVMAPVAIAGGGGALSGGTFQLSGTLGQPATATLVAAGYQLHDGFWAPVNAPVSDTIFANGFDP